MNQRVHSFDVFDTVLTRVYAAPDDVHLHVAEIAVQRGWAAVAAPLVQARRDAETRAWLEAGHATAVRVESIYRIVGERLGWSQAQARLLMDAELELEVAGVRAIPEMAEALYALRERGARICFISDMHLGHDQVSRMLLACGLPQPQDALFVSSKCGVSKRSGGRLFRHAVRALGVRPWQVRHHGDDWRADVGMAWRRGIPARHCPAARLNRLEHAVLAELPVADWRARSAVSASKFARLSAPAGQPNRALHDLLCSSVAPFVTGYALWLIEQARQRGLRALFFMARDMQVVCEVATALVRAKGLDLTCVYIHASRTAWQCAAYRADPVFDLFWLTDQPGSSNPLEALGRVLDAGTIAALQLDGGLRAVPDLCRRNTVAGWLQEPAVAQAVQREVVRRRGLLLSYLRQQGFTPDGRCALVDAGWRGTLQKCLARAYATEGVVARIPAFYIGLRHRVGLEDGCSMHAYLADADVARSGYSLVSLVEGFLTANHGTTLGYRSGPDGRIRPTLAGDPPAVVMRQCAAVRNACLAHAAELTRLPAIDADVGALTRAFAQPLLRLCGNPEAREAALLRRWLYDVGRATPLLKPLVARLSAKDFAKLVVARWRGTDEADVYLSGPWLRGSLAAANRIAGACARWLLGAGRRGAVRTR